jgi:hypothetical protein
MFSNEHNLTDSEMLRKKAEDQLKQKPKTNSKWNEESDKSKLIHELLLHEIELQLQNEKLREAYDVAETALKKYTMIFDLTPVGFITLGADGTIFDLNFAAADMLVDRRFSLINSNFKLYVSEESKSVFIDFLNNIFSHNEKESCKLKLGFDKNSLCDVYMEGISTGEDQKCLLSVINMTHLIK